MAQLAVLAGDFLLSRACVALASLKNTEVYVHSFCFVIIIFLLLEGARLYYVAALPCEYVIRSI